MRRKMVRRKTPRMTRRLTQTTPLTNQQTHTARTVAHPSRMAQDLTFAACVAQAALQAATTKRRLGPREVEEAGAVDPPRGAALLPALLPTILGLRGVMEAAAPLPPQLGRSAVRPSWSSSAKFSISGFHSWPPTRLSSGDGRPELRLTCENLTPQSQGTSFGHGSRSAFASSFARGTSAIERVAQTWTTSSLATCWSRVTTKTGPSCQICT